ncbi:hypothetical protein [Hoeflea alexandrii]|uniref:hypothetical protein n=1 Tax=Hoeflea alexandrii TaxID=288436 RepID=UPI0022AFF025|nr:hypothetical protein [Hoeflea alexandrii]MCZ4290976.1 hypothetical protein [Hoeflea alexandrii]
MINPSSNYAHSVTGLLDVPAEAAFTFMADPIALGQWSLGCMNTRSVKQTRTHSGHSLFDGAQGFFEIETDRDRLIVDYHLGSPEHMVPRVSARIVPADICGLGKEQCYVTLTAWRATDMDDARWHRLCVTHEAEMYLIKSQCEATYSRV